MGSHVLPAFSDDPLDSDRPWWLRLLRHTAEFTLAGYSATVGFFAFLNADTPANFHTGPLQTMPTPLTYIITAIICLGGTLAMTGIAIRIRNLKLELIIEQIGWSLMFIGWTAYVVGAHGYSEVTSATTLLTWIAAGSLARVVALAIHQHILVKRERQRQRVNRLIERMEDHDV